jgi:hypothetical protein
VVFPRGDLSAEYNLCWSDRKEVDVSSILKLFLVSVAAAVTITTGALAQWSIANQARGQGIRFQ